MAKHCAAWLRRAAAAVAGGTGKPCGEIGGGPAEAALADQCGDLRAEGFLTAALTNNWAQEENADEKETASVSTR